MDNKYGMATSRKYSSSLTENVAGVHAVIFWAVIFSFEMYVGQKTNKNFKSCTRNFEWQKLQQIYIKIKSILL